MFLVKNNQILKPLALQRWIVNFSSTSKSSIDYSSLPKLNEHDLEESFVRGSGPGGQATNKTSNCVVLKHRPTGITVKCHLHRMAHENRKEARRLLINKLDNLLNGEKSVENQEKAIQARKMNETVRRQRKLAEMKRKFKELQAETSSNPARE